MEVRLLFTLSLFFFALSGEAAPLIPLKTFANRAGLKVFQASPRSRILLEGNKREVFLLPGSPYLIIDGIFYATPTAPKLVKKEVLLSEDLVDLLVQKVLTKEERAKWDKDTEPKGVLCSLARPVKKIFLDPGHGGEDLGTKFGALKEKNIVLGFSKILADELRRRGFEVSFSRTRDVFLPLGVRSELASKWKADVFVSLHVNSAPGFSADGTETYILSADATDAAARKLALLENTIPKEAKKQASAVQDILWDMQQTAYLQDSARVGSFIQQEVAASAEELRKSGKLHRKWRNRGVRQAPFFVLSRAAMPAVLVELGYLTNAIDRRLLTEKFFQETLARSVADGLKKYRTVCEND